MQILRYTMVILIVLVILFILLPLIFNKYFVEIKCANSFPKEECVTNFVIF
jgi:hypothetical protein